MPDRTNQREAIREALRAFARRPLLEAAKHLLATLGYQSDRTLPIGTVAEFREQLVPEGKLTNRQREALNHCRSLHLLFQFTDAELFKEANALQTTRIESCLFFAAELPPGHYTRTDLATLVRAINKPLPMPALVLFRHGDTVSLGIIHRRLHKRDSARDVLEKVTLIKDINCADPIRAHIEILNDFALANLQADFPFDKKRPFVSLHAAWRKRLGACALSNAFYRKLLREASAAKDELAACDARIADIPKSFDTRYHALEPIRITHIENCIYGVDIHPVATQIAKLRFFISLVVDQKVAPTAGAAGKTRPRFGLRQSSGALEGVPGKKRQGTAALQNLPESETAWNLGVRHLFNLERNSSPPTPSSPSRRPKTTSSTCSTSSSAPCGVNSNRCEHFNARGPAAKRKCRERDAELRLTVDSPDLLAAIKEEGKI